jgi:AraC-like DNA-binding protein
VTPAGEAARYWRSDLLPGAELVTARYRQQVFSPHWHESYVVPIIEAGAQSYRYCHATLVAGPGSIAVINPGEMHTAQRATESGWAYRAFYPTIGFMERLAGELSDAPAGPPWLPPRTLDDADLAQRLLHAHRLLESGSAPLQAESALLEAFSLLLARHAGVKPAAAIPPADLARVKTMRERMAADLCEPVTLRTLALTVGLSPFHAARLFTRHTGMPPHAWRNQLRLNRAAGMLRRQIPVAEAAAACGYADQSHFTRHFKRAHGVAPGQWQRA